ncbi:MAG: hypothetical protein KAX78_02015 [Phycisphaerae bacterium]|nr:hypothetical protein [Phycisphaerae bacterium]
MSAKQQTIPAAPQVAAKFEPPVASGVPAPMPAPQDVPRAVRPPTRHMDWLGIVPRDSEDMWLLAKCAANSKIVPKDCKGDPHTCFMKFYYGGELGIRPAQSLNGIAIINGRPALWGDTFLGQILRSPVCDVTQFKEWFTGTPGADDYTAHCQFARVGCKPNVRSFSIADAKRAGLWVEERNRANNPTPWARYPKRMLPMRARGFCGRDTFADVLQGMYIAEELTAGDVLDQIDLGDEPAQRTLDEQIGGLQEAGLFGALPEQPTMPSDMEAAMRRQAPGHPLGGEPTVMPAQVAPPAAPVRTPDEALAIKMQMEPPPSPPAPPERRPIMGMPANGPQWKPPVPAPTPPQPVVPYVDGGEAIPIGEPPTMPTTAPPPQPVPQPNPQQVFEETYVPPEGTPPPDREPPDRKVPAQKTSGRLPPQQSRWVGPKENA